MSFICHDPSLSKPVILLAACSEGMFSIFPMPVTVLLSNVVEYAEQLHGQGIRMLQGHPGAGEAHALAVSPNILADESAAFLEGRFLTL